MMRPLVSVDYGAMPPEQLTTTNHPDAQSGQRIWFKPLGTNMFLGYVMLWAVSAVLLFAPEIVPTRSPAGGRADLVISAWLHAVPQALAIIAAIQWLGSVRRSKPHRIDLAGLFVVMAGLFAACLVVGTYEALFVPGMGLGLSLPIGLAIALVFILNRSIRVAFKAATSITR